MPPNGPLNAMATYADSEGLDPLPGLPYLSIGHDAMLLREDLTIWMRASKRVCFGIGRNVLSHYGRTEPSGMIVNVRLDPTGPPRENAIVIGLSIFRSAGVLFHVIVSSSIVATKFPPNGSFMCPAQSVIVSVRQAAQRRAH
jgi:hypothetical protein